LDWNVTQKKIKLARKNLSRYLLNKKKKKVGGGKEEQEGGPVGQLGGKPGGNGRKRSSKIMRKCAKRSQTLTTRFGVKKADVKDRGLP